MLIYDSHCHLGALSANPLTFPVAVPAILPTDLPDLVLYRQQNSLAKIGCGLHPWYMTEFTNQATYESYLRNLILKYQPDFIGECGLDKLKPEFDKQLHCLQIHLQLAQEFKLPIIIHCVRAYNELLQHLNQFPEVYGIVHAFNGNKELAKQLWRKNMFLGIGSIILNSNSQLYKSIAKIPIAQIILESDAPFMPGLNKPSSTNFDCLVYAEQLTQISAKNLLLVINESNLNWMKLFINSGSLLP